MAEHIPDDHGDTFSIRTPAPVKSRSRMAVRVAIVLGILVGAACFVTLGTVAGAWYLLHRSAFHQPAAPAGYTAVRIREGSTIAQLASQLGSQGVVSAADFQAQADADAQTFSYLGESPATKSLEGYLFPDTYFVPQHATSEEIIQKALSNIEKKFTPAMVSQAHASGTTAHDVLTLASIVEKEVSGDADRKIVAGIFLERMAIGMSLDSNAALGYVLHKDTSMLSEKDLQYASPYNDYVHKGLPPTPIGSPSLSSIDAVLNPTKTDYLYFIAAPGGIVVYAKTLDEQNVNIKKYLK